MLNTGPVYFKNVKLCVPEQVRYVLRRLSRTDRVSYIVGGAVRDLLTERPVNDYDIITSHDLATVATLFPRAQTNFSRLC